MAQELVLLEGDELHERRVDLSGVLESDAALTRLDVETLVAAYPSRDGGRGVVHIIDVSAEPQRVLEVHGPEQESAFHFGGRVEARGDSLLIQCRASNRMPGSKNWCVIMDRTGGEWRKALEIQGDVGLHDLAVDDGQCVIIGWQDMSFYRRDEAGNWPLVGTLADPPSARSCALLGDRLAVGGAGDVFIYGCAAGEWKPTENWRVGRKGSYPTVSVGLARDWLVVGNDAQAGKRQGTVLLCRHDGAKWREPERLDTGFSSGFAFDGERLDYARPPTKTFSPEPLLVRMEASLAS